MLDLAVSMSDNTDATLRAWVNPSEDVRGGLRPLTLVTALKVAELQVSHALQLLRQSAGLRIDDEALVRAITKAMTHPHGVLR